MSIIRTKRKVLHTQDAKRTIILLFSKSMWFQVEPLPNDLFEICIKKEEQWP